MNLFALSGLLIWISSTTLGLFVYLKDPQKTLTRLWALFSIAVGLWGFTTYKLATTHVIDEAFFWWKLGHVGLIFIPVLFFHFTYKFLNLDKRSLLIGIYALGGIFLFLNTTDLLIRNMRFVFSSFYYDSPPGPAYPYFVLFFIGTILYSHYELINAFKYSSGIRKNQIKYFFLASLVGFTTGETAFLPVFGIDFYPYLNLVVPLYPIIMSYAIVKYRLWDITVVMSKGLTYALILGGILIPSYLAVSISARATLYSLPPLISGTLVFAFGLWVLIQSPRSRTHQTLGLLSFASATWLFGFFMIYSSTDSQQARFWGQFLHVGVILSPALFNDFVRCFLKQSASKLKTYLPYLISISFLMLIPTPYLINDQYSYFWGNYPKAGPFYPLFLTYFFGYAVYCLRSLYLGFKSQERVNPQEGVRTKYVFFAFLIGFTASIDFIQNYGVEFYPIGFIFITLWIFMVSFATAKYQVLEIPLTIPKNTIFWYVREFAIILIFYFTIVAIIWSFTGSQHFILTAILLVAFSIFSELLLPLQKDMERAIGQTIFKQRHDALKTLTSFSQDLVAILDLNDLNTRFLNTLSRALGVSNLSLFVFEKEKDIFLLASSQGVLAESMEDQTFSAQHVLPNHFKTHKSILIREELEHFHYVHDQQEILGTLKHMDAELSFPLINKDRLVGFCNLGPRTSLEMYSEEELSLLTALAQNAALALDHALLYEDWKRSQLLMKRTDRLRSLETIAGGFAHEIRNPLTSIKTFIQLAPERRNDGEFITDFSRVVNEDVNRIERLIEEVLDYARYMKPRLTEEDLNEIVTSCLYFIQVKAGSQGITLEQDLSQNIPYVMVDRQQFKQVLLNLLLNALEAITHTSGKIKISTHRLHKDSKEDWVQIEVSDTGPGISPANLEHIFDPFYTTKHESGEHEGTGLGLAIVHQIVQEHHGTIHVESGINTGTTFFVDIPASPCHATPNTVIGGT